MPNEEQLAILKRGPELWNAWRREHVDSIYRPKSPVIWDNVGVPDFRKADLSRANLHGADLNKADLRGANLRGASLGATTLLSANLRKADLCGALLSRASLYRTDLAGANLREANLFRSDFFFARLDGADLGGARLNETIFTGVDLRSCKGLDNCVHDGPSTLDHRTLQGSGLLPLAFLHGVGLPEALINYLPSLLHQPIQFYSCFISYSSQDQAFAEQLHADLQDKGVRCWFAPEDLKIGDRLAETIDAAIRVRDKLLLILSETSVASAWVLKEVRTALAEEERHGRTVLFPVRLDDAVMDTTEQWAHDLRRTRHIGDFTRWEEHDAYQKALERLLRDLKVAAS